MSVSETKSIDIERLREFFMGLQDRITGAVSEADGQPFSEDAWTKEESSPLRGDGRSRMIEEGELMERAGVGFSHVRGDRLPPSATAARP